MPYATQTDLAARFGAEEMSALAEGADLDVALSDAEEEANSYVAVRYKLPLPEVPQPLKIAVCDIARFRLYNDRATEEVKYRYERQIKWLEQLAAGKTVLTFDPALTPEQEEEIVSPATPLGAYAPAAVFNDETLNRMPTIGNSSVW